jgi:phosphate transport system substrate-binding protein
VAPPWDPPRRAFAFGSPARTLVLAVGSSRQDRVAADTAGVRNGPGDLKGEHDVKKLETSSGHVRGRAARLSTVAITAIALVMAFAGPGFAGQRVNVTLNGAGSTFDAPLFTSAFYTYHAAHADVAVNYAAVGSGAGIAQFQAGTVNFGATDVPMTHDQVAAAKGPTLQVPVALGGVSLIYHLPGVQRGLHLDAPTIAGIFLGNIQYWDSAAIRNQNPGVHLSHLKITVVHRSDGSGTTYIFTDYLGHVSSAWANGPGTSTTISWPAGVGEPGSAGVSAVVRQTTGAIGYVELSYAVSNHITFARVKNSAGNYISPGPNTVASAASAFPNVSAAHFSIVNASGSRSYPISGYSWMLLYKSQSSQTTGDALAHLAEWLTHQGQALGKPLLYVPLPASIQALAEKTLKKMVGPSGDPFL